MAKRIKKGHLPKEVKKDSVIDINEARRARQATREAEQNRKEKKKIKKKNTIAERQPKKLSKRVFVYLGVLTIIVILLIVSITRVVSLKKQELEAQAALEEMNNRKEELNAVLEDASSDEYIEQQARDLLKMIKPGEIFYVLPEADDSGTQGNISGDDSAFEDNNKEDSGIVE